MLVNKQVIFHIMRNAKRTIYLTTSEVLDLQKNCTPLEFQLYTILKHSGCIQPTPDYFDDQNLADVLDTSLSTLRNAKSGLKTKGYALIKRFKDERGDKIIKIIVGQDQFKCYEIGLNVEITDSRRFKELIEDNNLFDTKLTDVDRMNMVDKINKEHRENK